ncbi:unnamed protein product [Triticum turgidum subsp. durum]|uniref:Uncharacterized protein n=1 Tax=Triticum turgidum subsp. durum TaxID=4567 RepID=A0A9R0V709_TRITD|nr:unnamed protein product [Triticum turgidum subsp. durum]
MDEAYHPQRASSMTKQVKKKGKHPALNFNRGSGSSSENLIVYILRRPMLETVTETIRLKVQGYTCWYVHEGMMQASVLIALPRQEGSFRESSITYEGESANTEDEAMEKAAQMALECICADYNISVNDHNYYALEVTKERLFTAREKAQTKQWQFNMARQQVTTQQNEFARQTMILAKICNNFYDILPLRMYPQRPTSSDPIITYTGAHRPVRRMEEFAKSLYHFITGTNPVGGYTRMI